MNVNDKQNSFSAKIYCRLKCYCFLKLMTSVVFKVVFVCRVIIIIVLTQKLKLLSASLNVGQKAVRYKQCRQSSLQEFGKWSPVFFQIYLVNITLKRQLLKKGCKYSA